MRFAPNRTLGQRAQDKRLGQIKHQLHERGHALQDIKIVWRKNLVKLKDRVIYKLGARRTHEYFTEGLIVKEVVEKHIKEWLEQRGAEESD